MTHAQTIAEIKARRRLKVIQTRPGLCRGNREDRRRMTKGTLQMEAFLYPESVDRPKTREDCEHSRRPCPFVGCRWHLWMDVTEAGSLVRNFPGKEPWEIAPSCALDVAEVGPHGLSDIGPVLNVSRQRIDQIMRGALAKLAENGANLRSLLESDPEW